MGRMVDRWVFWGLGLPCGPGNDFYGGSGWAGSAANSGQLNFHQSATYFRFDFQVGDFVGMVIG